MTEAQKAQIKNAVMLLLSAGFTVTGPNGKTASPKSEALTAPAPKAASAPAPVKAAAAPTVPLTKDGRHGYTCGICHQPGHNARTHPVGGHAAAAPAKTQAVSPAAVKAATPKAPAPLASVALDDLDFEMEDLGGATVNVPTPAPVKAAPKAAAPTPKAAPKASPPPAAPEAGDSEVDAFLSELDGLDALLPG